MGQPASEIRKILREGIRDFSGELRNYTSPGHVGVADTLLLFPGCRIIFCEIKAVGDFEKSPQERERHRMTQLGFEACVVHGQLGAEMLLDRLRLGIRVEGEING